MFSNPNKVVNILGITPGMTIADIGAGSGEYTMALGKALAGSGKVYAVDVQKELLGKIKQRASEAGLGTVEVVWGDADEPGGTGLSDNIADIVVASNVLFQIEKKQQFAKEMTRIVKPTGKIMIVDWTDSFGGLGPQPEAVVTAAKVEELFKVFDFTKVRVSEGGEHHYALLLQKTA